MKKALCHLTDISTVLVFYLAFWAAVVLFGGFPLALDNFYFDAPLIALKKLPFPYPGWFQYSFLAALGLAAFVPILNPFRSKSGLYGSAHWATEREMKKMGLRDRQGLILAIKGRDYIRTNKPLSVLVYAPPGSGKTAGIIIPSLISCSNSAIVHDSKGELYAKTSKRREQFSKIIKFSPGEKGSLKWNPLSKEELPKNWADIQVHVDRVSNTVIPDNPKNPGEHWPKAGRAFFMFWALFLIHRDGETSLPDVLREPFRTDDIKEAIALIIDEYADNLPERVLFEGNGLIGTPDTEFGSIVSTFKTNLNVFFDTRVAENMSGSDFTLMDLRKERTTIYITVKNSDQTRLKSIMALLFETCTLAMLDHEPTKDEYPVTAYLDEFVRMSRMQELLEMPAIGRSYKFNAIYICQSFSQIVDIYGQAGADQLKNTCSFHVFFAQNEQKVAEDISKSIGDLTRDRISESSGSGRSLVKNKSTSNEGFKLIMPQEIMSLPFGTVLICQQNNFETPVKAQSAFWFKDSAIKPHVRDIDYKDISDSVDPEPVPKPVEAPKQTVTTINNNEGLDSIIDDTVAADPDGQDEASTWKDPEALGVDPEDLEAAEISVSEFMETVGGDPENEGEMNLDELMGGLTSEDMGFDPDEISIDDFMGESEEDEDNDEGPRPS